MDWTALMDARREALLRVVMALTAALRIGMGIGGGTSLPRHLRLALVRLVRPAEAAARRLVVIAAWVEGLTPPEVSTPKARAGRRAGASSRAARALQLALADALPDPTRHRPVRQATRGCPRITFLDEPAHVAEAREAARARALAEAAAAKRVRAEDAARLVARLDAVRAALDDLPAQARRLMGWCARQERRRLADRPSRLSPIRHGRPRASVRRAAARHSVHDQLDRLHAIAVDLPHQRRTPDIASA